MSPPDGFELSSRPHERRVLAENDVWCVYELQPTRYSPNRAGCLVFESTKVVRRVRDYPPNWRDLCDADLILLKERT